MPKSRETYVKLTEKELDALLKDATAGGGEYVAEELKEKVAHLDRAARVEIGLITIQDICTFYGITPNTVRNWGIEPVGYPGQQNLYDVDEIKNQITE
jgi:hypothetical protein